MAVLWVTPLTKDLIIHEQSVCVLRCACCSLPVLSTFVYALQTDSELV